MMMNCQKRETYTNKNNLQQPSFITTHWGILRFKNK